MGIVRRFLKALEKYEQTDAFKEYEKEASLTCSKSIKNAMGFIMMDTRGVMDPKEIERLLLLEWNI